MDTLHRESKERPGKDQICSGTLLSRIQYLSDITRSDWKRDRTNLYLDGEVTPKHAR
jgi:hypothetical protein